jgi:hypothetical protein
MIDTCGERAPSHATAVCTLVPGHAGGHHSSIAGITWTNHDAPRPPAPPETVLGVELGEALPDGWQPQGVIVLVRAIDADGRRRITHLEGGDVMLWEAMGLIDAAKRDFAARLDALNDCLEHGPVE